MKVDARVSVDSARSMAAANSESAAAKAGQLFRFLPLCGRNSLQEMHHLGFAASQSLTNSSTLSFVVSSSVSATPLGR